MRNKTGQEAIEFSLIVILVFFAALGVILVFSGKIANFFTRDSSVVKVAQATPNIISADSQPRFTPDYETTIPYVTEVFGGIPTKIYDDGSAAFVVEGKAFTLPANLVELQDIVTESVGTEGLEDLVSEIAYLMKKFKLEDPNIDVWFGEGHRKMDTTVCKTKGFIFKKVTCSNGIKDFTGKAKVENVLLNTIVIKLDDHLVMLQKDQNVPGDAFSGKYRIEGLVDENNHFVGDVECKSKNITGVYETDINLDNGLVFNNGKYEQNVDGVSDQKFDDGFLGFGSDKKKAGTHKTGNWEIKFQNSNFKFEL